MSKSTLLLLFLVVIFGMSLIEHRIHKVHHHQEPYSILRMDADAFDKEVTNGCTIYTSKDGTCKVLFSSENPNLVTNLDTNPNLEKRE